MVPKPHLDALKTIYARLHDSTIPWAVTGSLGMALQGMPTEVHDVDLQTDAGGAYEIEKRLSDWVVCPVRYSTAERIRSHFGVFEIHGVRVEVMGGLQKRVDDQNWEPPVRVQDHRRWVEIEGMRVPVLSLAYEHRAYRRLGRIEKAEAIRRWLHSTSSPDACSNTLPG